MTSNWWNIQSWDGVSLDVDEKSVHEHAVELHHLFLRTALRMGYSVFRIASICWASQLILFIVKIYDDPGSIQPAAGVTLLGCLRLTNAIERGLKYLLFVDLNGANTMQHSTTSLLHHYYQHADFSGTCSMPSSKQPCQVLIEIIVLYWSLSIAMYPELFLLWCRLSILDYNSAV